MHVKDQHWCRTHYMADASDFLGQVKNIIALCHTTDTILNSHDMKEQSTSCDQRLAEHVKIQKLSNIKLSNPLEKCSTALPKHIPH